MNAHHVFHWRVVGLALQLAEDLGSADSDIDCFALDLRADLIAESLALLRALEGDHAAGDGWEYVSIAANNLYETLGTVRCTLAQRRVSVSE